MRFSKKVLPLFLTAVFSVLPLYTTFIMAFAQNSVEFSLDIVSESAAEVKVEFSLVSGSFNSLDMGFETGDNIVSCTALTTSNNYKAFADKVEGEGNTIICVATLATMKAAMSTTADYSAKGPIFVATFKKKADIPVNVDDISVTIPACVELDDKYNAEDVKVVLKNTLPSKSGKCGSSLVYKYLSDSKKLIIDGNGKMTDWLLVKSVVWNDIAADVLTVDLPKDITSIGKNAFNGFKSLKTIAIPAAVKSIGDSAFSNCSSLQKISVEKTVESIGRNVFSNCEAVVLRCNIGSAAYNYAVDNSIKYELIDKYIIGDVNSDSKINSTDALTVLQFAIGDKKPNSLQKITSDLNNDKKSNSVDALIILQIVVGDRKISEFQR